MNERKFDRRKVLGASVAAYFGSETVSHSFSDSKEDEEGRCEQETQQLPFYSANRPEITISPGPSLSGHATTLGKSRYHFSGFHSQRVSDGKLIMDQFTVLGQPLGGADLGPVLITLKQPLTARLAEDGSFNRSVPLILTSGSSESEINGTISGRLNLGRAFDPVGFAFASLCFSTENQLADLGFSASTIQSNISIAAA
jgi:hypothetical protein